MTALAGVAAIALNACASNRASVAAPDFSGLTAEQSQQNVEQWAAQFQARPNDKRNAIYYAAALRAAGQPAQAVEVLQQATLAHPDDTDITIAYAKALAADGRFNQALTIIEGAIRIDSPDWNALNVKGAILDQMGRNGEARRVYSQALLIAPNQASIDANLGLSFAMTGDLVTAEQHLRSAVGKRGANSQIRQNLALVVGLQGRFAEARALYAAELPPEQVEANMAYVRALLTQQNRWDLIAGDN
ncbi:MAG TPA: tetratricopeptide repeat protein [Devosiaceae bacterium]|nr:tetratricopeptide repeat protein [Devosiaceae bacterium]